MPDIDWEPWFQFNRPWTTVIEQASVDQQRTSALQQWNHFIQTNAGKPAFNGVTRGMPFQVVDSNKGSTAVWQDQIPVKWNWFRPTFPTINTPLPTIVQRQGDPGGFATDDTHWIGLEPGKGYLWETISLRKGLVFPWRLAPTWVCSYVSKWNLSLPWDHLSQPKGAIAIKVPLLPLLVRWDEVARGDIGHCISISVNQYSSEYVGWARGSDGKTAGHPLRGGDLLRLKPEVVESIPDGTIGRVLANAMHKYGALVADKNTMSLQLNPASPPGAMRMTMDARWQNGEFLPPMGTFAVQLTDFEVIDQ
jgi:hypothetical protein